VRAYVALGGLTPDDVAVELVAGRAREDDALTEVTHRPLVWEAESNGANVYGGSIEFERAGAFGYTVRVVPRHPHLASSAELGLVATPVG
jgi:starch phosphorylase